MKVVKLSQYPQYCEDIAKHTFSEWPEQYKNIANIKSEGDWLKILKTMYTIDGVWPMAYVAIGRQNQFVAFLSVELNNEVKITPHNSIWLCNIFVVPKYRNHGVATGLVNAVCNILITKYSAKEVYLWYDDKSLTTFYEKLGFHTFSQYPYKSYQMTIAKKVLDTPMQSMIQPVHIIGLFTLLLIIYFFRRKGKNVVIGNPS
jgi:GNAT superfamily N-acetyltransferase